MPFEVSVEELLAKIGELTVTKDLLERQLAAANARIAELEGPAEDAAA